MKDPSDRSLKMTYLEIIKPNLKRGNTSVCLGRAIVNLIISFNDFVKAFGKVRSRKIVLQIGPGRFGPDR
jgi:hypothetical protein